MKCQKCGAANATTHISEIINGTKSESYLCSSCAQEIQKGYTLKSILNTDFEDFLGSFFAIPGASVKQKAPISCPSCKTTFYDIQKFGRLGCGDCYTAFRDFLVRPLKEIHGSLKHTGKIPKRLGKDIRLHNEIDSLKNELNAAVQNQDFEKAAILRDRIKDMEKQGKEG